MALGSERFNQTAMSSVSGSRADPGKSVRRISLAKNEQHLILVFVARSHGISGYCGESLTGTCTDPGSPHRAPLPRRIISPLSRGMASLRITPTVPSPAGEDPGKVTIDPARPGLPGYPHISGLPIGVP